MKNGRGSLSRASRNTIWTCSGTMCEVQPVFGLSGLMQAVVLLCSHSPLPPSFFEVWNQLYSLTSSPTSSTS